MKTVSSTCLSIVYFKDKTGQRNCFAKYKNTRRADAFVTCDWSGNDQGANGLRPVENEMCRWPTGN